MIEKKNYNLKKKESLRKLVDMVEEAFNSGIQQNFVYNINEILKCWMTSFFIEQSL